MADRLALWRSLEAQSSLACPVCQGSLRVADRVFDCLSCSAVYPVAGGVPLLLPPDEVVSVPDQVLKAFNIPPGCKEQVQAALTTLTEYRTHGHPEFANFFNRFEGREAQLQPVPLTVAATAAAVAGVECLTQHFPGTLRSDQAEFRSIRLRNGSDRVLFTDERYPLYVGYRVVAPEGGTILCEGSGAPLPVPLRPGGELTVPIKVELPEGLAGACTIRFYFLLAGRSAAEPPPPAPIPPVPAPTRLSMLRKGVRVLLRGPAPIVPIAPPVSELRWFDDAALAEMHVSAVTGDIRFPAGRRDERAAFDVGEDVARAEGFLSGVIGDLRSRGVARPRVLEIGAGVYPISLRTCDADMTVVVSDISLVMQTLATVMHANNPAVLEGRAGFASFDMMHPPFQDGTFDVICICAALHHIALPEGFFKRLAPLLSPQGRFVALREPCEVNPFEPTYIAELANGFNEQMFELAEWSAMIAGGGMTIDHAVVDYDCSLKFSARITRPAHSGAIAA